ncbi:MAG: hypothetical protein WBR17_06980 [Paraburkholderia sp.]|uniref:VOC family protein n=1 Tax=Paraburkholderia sp. TaxID=1926495 RepID=UPI003C3567F2
MSISKIHHFTIRCVPDDLPTLLDFYSKYFQLTPGPRPAFPFPGHWLYCDGQPIVHVAGCLDEKGVETTGPLDHISFRAHGLEKTREFFRAEGLSFAELPVEGWPLHQLFLYDPNGLKLELTFDLNEEEGNKNGQLLQG